MDETDTTKIVKCGTVLYEFAYNTRKVNITALESNDAIDEFIWKLKC
jgi:hypothetical protein